MNDVIIGKGDYGNVATRIFAIEGDHNISENKVSYWANDVYLGLGLVLFKNINEGKK